MSEHTQNPCTLHALTCIFGDVLFIVQQQLALELQRATKISLADVGVDNLRHAADNHIVFEDVHQYFHLHLGEGLHRYHVLQQIIR